MAKINSIVCKKISRYRVFEDVPLDFTFNWEIIM